MGIEGTRVSFWFFLPLGCRGEGGEERTQKSPFFRISNFLPWDLSFLKGKKSVTISRPDTENSKKKTTNSSISQKKEKKMELASFLSWEEQMPKENKNNGFLHKNMMHSTYFQNRQRIILVQPKLFFNKRCPVNKTRSWTPMPFQHGKFWALAWKRLSFSL